MAKMAEVQKLLTPERMREICESHPTYHGYLAAQRKESELQARLHSIVERESAWRNNWRLAHSEEGQAKVERKVKSDYEQFLDTDVRPESKSLMEALQKEKANLRDEETLLKGAIEIQKMRVMEAKNAYISAVMPKLRAMHKPVFRQYLADCLAMNKKTEAIRGISDEGERWELLTGGFHSYVPWIKHPGRATDAISWLQNCLRSWVEDGMITEDERVNMLHGGEFIP